MKNCTDCKHALWYTTAAGELHPSGNGNCTYKWVMPPLPQAFYWLYHELPKPLGGHINRRTDMKDHCTCYARKP